MRGLSVNEAYKNNNCIKISSLQVIYRTMEKDLNEKLQITAKNHSTSQESPILKLNDDCLVNIFKFLTIRDRLIAERGTFTD